MDCAKIKMKILKAHRVHDGEYHLREEAGDALVLVDGDDAVDLALGREHLEGVQDAHGALEHGLVARSVMHGLVAVEQVRAARIHELINSSSSKSNDDTEKRVAEWRDKRDTAKPPERASRRSNRENQPPRVVPCSGRRSCSRRSS